MAGRSTVLANHCYEFIAHPNARTGVLNGNPIHKDMLWAANKTGLRFIVNVVLNSEKDIVYAVAGDPEKAQEKGTEFLSSLCGVCAEPADIVISTNGGYPLDQNIYQAVKGMTAAEAAVKTGGVIVMLAASGDGTGGDSFYHMIADDDIQNSMKTILSRGRMETIPDQWEAQILIRIHMKASVIYISDMPDEIIKSMHMIPTNTLDDALETAKTIINKDKVCITVIPDGIAVMM